MKLILQQEVKNLGKKGDVIEASEGYARNYLLPRKLAIPATAGNVNAAQQQKENEARKAKRILDEARLHAAQIAKLQVTVAVKTGEGGRLFGSVTSKDVADALKNQHGLDLDKRKIELKDAIKALGAYPVTIKLHPEVSAQIEVQVTAQ
ncbi:50S ribosomal protein L9 [Anaeroselena agilis]|uniref:Large ribosomal subunit protein bL9 n=1 Tax=Anaeroselena agilis TaxID=3063788 RepID=A0ABU3P2L1_9FIRM|nr:50S ribosomal protein L9 [Selenomonadales bacterium 4137-cl]